MNTVSTSPSLSQRLALVLGTLRAVLAAGIGREPARVALLLLAWNYLGRLERRFASLVARVASGRAFRLAPRPGAATPRECEPRQSLPSGFGWMMQLTPGVLPLRSQIRHLLADPELAALLAAAPQAGRILRPLCRMLGIPPSPDLPPTLLTPTPRPPASIAAPLAPPWRPTAHASAPSARAAPLPGDEPSLHLLPA